MSDKREKTRSELLNELQSIQGLLDNDDIPLLEEVIDHLDDAYAASEWQTEADRPAKGDHQQDASSAKSNTLKTADAKAKLATEQQPHQQQAQTRAGAFAENPFLPQHIRSRLKGNRAGDFGSETDRVKNTQRQQLLDEVIDDLLPQLKATLRTKLSQLTNEQLKALNSQER